MTAAATKPWLAHYTPGKPADIEPEFPDMLSAFAASVARAPEQVILRYFDGRMTLRELDAAAGRLASALAARGFGKGDRLALFTQNDPCWVIGALATWKAGGIAVCVNPMNKEREVSYLLKDSGAKAVLCLDTLHPIVRNVMEREPTAVEFVITASALDGQTQNDARILRDTERLPTPAGALDLRALLANPAGHALPAPRYAPDDVALLTYTSGTTGEPKGVMNTHGNLLFNAQVYRDWLDLTPADVILGVAPLFHITGSVAHACTALLTGCPLVLAHRFHAEAMLDVIRAHRPTFTIGSITVFIAFMNAAGAKKDDFASFRAIYSGGAPISPATNQAFRDFSGHTIHNAYGMTETASPSHLVPLGAEAPVDPNSGALSVGLPVFNTTVRILRDDGSAADVGEVGEIADRGPQIMRGYWNKPEATAKALRNGEMHTGDVGFMDAEGWFYVVDRKKDMIDASGYKVWPREVEDVLYGHPAVREAAVVGVPDSYRGETVKAVVSLKPGAHASADELKAYCKANMAAYKYPRIVEIRDELPKTVSGKILRRDLR